VNKLLQSSSFLNITINNLVEIAGQNGWRRRKFLAQFINTGFYVVQSRVRRSWRVVKGTDYDIPAGPD